MMLAPGAIEAVLDMLDPGDFFRDSHARIYRTVVSLYGNGVPVDAITLVAALEEAGDLAEVGGRVRIFELARLVPTVSNVRHYAEIVRKMSTLRGFIRVGGEMAQLGWEGEGDVRDLLIRAEQLVSELSERRSRTDTVITLYDAARYLDEKFRNPPEEGFGIQTPWSWLPSMHGGRLYVLGGYQADGKTVQASHFFRTAVSAGVPTTFLSLEMSKEDMAERLAANMGLPAKLVQSGHLLEEHKPAAAKIIGDLVRWGDTGRIWDAPGVDLAQIRRHMKVVRPKLLIVDHLHQFHLRAEYERQDLEAIVQGLWLIAREFDCAVLLLAQLSRTGDKKNPYPVPTMASLRGSAMIEALAWAVYFVWRKRDENNLATSDALWIVAKNRSGPVGTKLLEFVDRQTRFIEIAREA